MNLLRYIILVFLCIYVPLANAEPVTIKGTIEKIIYYSETNNLSSNLKNVILIRIKTDAYGTFPVTCELHSDENETYNALTFSADDKDMLSMTLIVISSNKNVILGIDDTIKYPESTGYCKLQSISVVN